MRPPSSCLRPRVRPCLPWIAIVLALCACRATTTETSAVAAPRELLQRADRAFDTRAYTEALEKYKVAVLAADETGDTDTFVEAAAQTANVLALRGEYVEGREWLRRASDEASAEHVGPWSRFLLVRGVYEDAGGDEAAAEGTFEELYRLGLAHGRSDRALQAAHMATLVTSGEAQIAWARKGIDVARAAGEPRWEAEQWMNLAWLLEGHGQFEEALRAFRSGHALIAPLGGERERVKADWTLAHGLRMAGQDGAARELLDRANAAVRRRYRNLGGARNDAEWIARCESELAELDASAGDPRSALRRLATADRYFREAGVEIHAPDSYAQLQVRMGELREAALRGD